MFSVIAPIIVVCIALVLYFILKQHKDIKGLKIKNGLLEEENKKVIHHRKSSEVRLGKIGENMAPFFDGWPFDPNDFRFLGNPVDGIQFNDDEVIFVEIKTGKARLTDGQRNLKKIVKEGKVKFATFRVGEDGCKLSIEGED